MDHLKLRMIRANGAVEVRRLPDVPERAASLENLRKTIEECKFEGLKGLDYTISYLDNEGDMCMITNDAELAASFEARQGLSVVDLVIRPKMNEPRVFKKRCPAVKVVQCHRGVVCDGCGASPIVGDRFKCTVRPDFDLCASCKVDDSSGYAMVKLAPGECVRRAMMEAKKKAEGSKREAHGGGSDKDKDKDKDEDEDKDKDKDKGRAAMVAAAMAANAIAARLAAGGDGAKCAAAVTDAAAAFASAAATAAVSGGGCAEAMAKAAAKAFVETMGANGGGGGHGEPENGGGEERAYGATPSSASSSSSSSAPPSSEATGSAAEYQQVVDPEVVSEMMMMAATGKGHLSGKKCGGVEEAVAESASMVAESAAVEASLRETKGDSAKSEASGATQEGLDAIKIATMASLESFAAEQEGVAPAAGPTNKSNGGSEECKASEGADDDEKYDDASSFEVIDGPVGSNKKTDKKKKEEEEAFTPGLAVELHSLSNRDYVGLRGTVVAAVPGKQRVIVDVGGEKVAVKAANLKVLDNYDTYLRALDDMGFLDLLGRDDCLDRLRAHASKLDEVLKVDMDEVINGIVASFQEA